MKKILIFPHSQTYFDITEYMDEWLVREEKYHRNTMLPNYYDYNDRCYSPFSYEPSEDFIKTAMSRKYGYVFDGKRWLMYRAKIKKFMYKSADGKLSGPHYDYYFEGRPTKTALVRPAVFKTFMELINLDLANLLVDPNQVLRENAIKYSRSLNTTRRKKNVQCNLNV